MAAERRALLPQNLETKLRARRASNYATRRMRKRMLKARGGEEEEDGASTRARMRDYEMNEETIGEEYEDDIIGQEDNEE